MRFVLSATLLVALCLVFVNADAPEWGDNEFQSEISKHENVLVMFYAPWCGHCKRLKPEYEAASKALRSYDPPITLAKVDCTEAGKDTCSKFGVSGYPTLKIFKNGEESKDYAGPRDKDGIIRYMKAQVGPVSLELKSNEDLTKFITNQAPCVVGYFKDDSSSLKASFLKIADKLREKLNFAHTLSEKILEDKKISSDVLEINRPPHLHNKLEDNTAVYSGSADLTAIQEFIEGNVHGLVGHRTRESQGDFTSPLVTAYYKVDYKKNPKGTNYWRNRILKVAKKFVGTFKFAISSVDEFQNELNDFGIDYVPGDKPVVGVLTAKKEKFILDKDFSVEKLEEFLNDVQDGKLQPFLKSEPIPEDNSGPVKVAVGKNFKELVEESGRDSFIEFYAPWCGHCKKLAPVWEKLGTELEGEKVDIIKMDATSNDIPAPFRVHGYPTLYWAPANNKQNPVKYEGARELKDLLSYVAKHATEELEGYDRYGKSKTGKDEL